jgi:hypothetical protein
MLRQRLAGEIDLWTPGNLPPISMVHNGIPVVVVPYGYNGGEDPRLLPADAHVEGLAQLPGLLAATAARDSA